MVERTESTAICKMLSAVSGTQKVPHRVTAITEIMRMIIMTGICQSAGLGYLPLP